MASSRSLVYGVTGGVGYLLAIDCSSPACRERLELPVPQRRFEGLPHTLVTAGQLGWHFMGF